MSPQIDRRSFIVAGGMTALASTRVLGANDTLRVGIIGAGGRMGDLMNAADKVGGWQIAAVCDVYAPRRDAVKERPNGGSASDSRRLSRTPAAAARRGVHRHAGSLACAHRG